MRSVVNISTQTTTEYYDLQRQFIGVGVTIHDLKEIRMTQAKSQQLQNTHAQTRWSHLGLVLAASLVVAGCATGTKALDPKLESGFLDGYNRLQPIESGEQGVSIYRYKNPNVDFSKYNAVIIEPVVIYQTTDADTAAGGLNEQTLYQVRQQITNNIRADVAKRAKVVTKPGPGVANISIAITGAKTLSDGFRPTDLIPVRAVLNVASKATGLDSKNAVLVVEVKVNDSQSGELIGQALYTVAGESFRLETSSVQAFEKLADKWVKTALRVATDHRP